MTDGRGLPAYPPPEIVQISARLTATNEIAAWRQARLVRLAYIGPTSECPRPVARPLPLFAAIRRAWPIPTRRGGRPSLVRSPAWRQCWRWCGPDRAVRALPALVG